MLIDSRSALIGIFWPIIAPATFSAGVWNVVVAHELCAQDSYVLHAGNIAMPQLAFGTGFMSYSQCRFRNNHSCVQRATFDRVRSWIEAGGVHIDTANHYQTQVYVGQAIAASKLGRYHFFLTTKCHPFGFSAVIQCMNDNLQMLSLNSMDVFGRNDEFVDLLLLNGPYVPCGEGRQDYCDPGVAARQSSWKAMALIRDRGAARSIGVSNYNAEQIEETLRSSTAGIDVIQAPFPWLVYDEAIIAVCRLNNIRMMAYAPVRFLGFFTHDNKTVAVARNYGFSGLQVLLKWSLQRGLAVVTTSGSSEHIHSTLTAGCLTLRNDEMNALSDVVLSQRSRYAGRWALPHYPQCPTGYPNSSTTTIAATCMFE